VEDGQEKLPSCMEIKTTSGRYPENKQKHILSNPKPWLPS